MEVFNCPRCAVKSTFDPWKESAHCPKCGYSPTLMGEKKDWRFQGKVHDDNLSWIPDTAFAIHKVAKRDMAVHLVLVREADNLVTFGRDARLLAQVCGAHLLVTNRLSQVQGPVARFPFDEREDYLHRLQSAGIAAGIAQAQISICPQCEHNFRVDDFNAPGGKCPMCDYSPESVNHYIKDLLDRAIDAAEANDFGGAASLLEERVLKNRLEPELEAGAWLQLADVTADLYVKQTHLKKALLHDPNNLTAQKRMAQVNEIIYTQDDEIKATGTGDSDIGSLYPAEEITHIERFECPECGGVTRYEPGVFGLLCKYCGYQQPVPDPEVAAELEEVREQSFYAAMASLQAHAKSLTARMINCPACGAEYIIGAKTLSFNCPYCAAACVIERASYREILSPTAVLPFIIRQEQAEQIIEDWSQGKKWRILARFQPVSGIYLPVWTFDMEGELTWSRETDGSGELIGIPVHQRRGQKFVVFDDILIPASTRIRGALSELVMEFERTRLAPYDELYLADHPAEHYEIKLSDAAIKARGVAANSSRDIIAGELGKLDNIQIRTAGLAVVTFKLILVPIWLAHISIDEMSLDLIVHGHSGIFGAARSSHSHTTPG